MLQNNRYLAYCLAISILMKIILLLRLGTFLIWEKAEMPRYIADDFGIKCISIRDII